MNTMCVTFFVLFCFVIEEGYRSFFFLFFEIEINYIIIKSLRYTYIEIKENKLFKSRITI
jgi:hypothetical protein